MKAIVLTKEMKEAMAQLNRTLPKQRYTSIYTQVLIEARACGISLSTYNGTYATRVHVSVHSGADFDLCIDATALKKAVDSSKGKTIEIASDGALSSAGIDYRPSMPIAVEDMPTFSTLPGDMLVMDGAVLTDALFRTKDVMSKDLSRVDFHGLNFTLRNGELHVVGTDGHRLHCTACEVRATACEALEGRGVIVPSSTIAALHSMLRKWPSTVHIAYAAKTFQFFTDKFEIQTSLVPGQFPDHQRVIPKRSDLVLAVDRDALLAAAKGVEQWAPKARCITVEHSDNAMRLHANGEDGEASASLTVHPKHPMDKRYGMDASYLVQALSTAKGMLEIGVTGADDPIVLREVGNWRVTYVIMPMHLDKDK